MAVHKAASKMGRRLRFRQANQRIAVAETPARPRPLSLESSARPSAAPSFSRRLFGGGPPSTSIAVSCHMTSAAAAVTALSLLTDALMKAN